MSDELGACQGHGWLTRGLVPDRTVGELLERAWALRARCAHCRGERVWRRAELEATFPAGARLSGIRARLVCRCDGRDGLVDLLNDTAEANRRALDAVATAVRVWERRA